MPSSKCFRLNPIWLGDCRFYISDRYAVPYRSPEKLGRHDKIFSFPSKCLDGFAHSDLAFAFSVYLGGIKEVDSMLPSFFHTLQGQFFANLTTISDPSSQG